MNTNQDMAVTERELTYREALQEALHEALMLDQKIFLMGEDVGRYGGAYAISKGLLEEFGPERIRDTPLCESAFIGAGIGAALAGMLPIVEVMTVNFIFLGLDQIINNAATMRHMSGGQLQVPLVIRTVTGAGRQLAAQHSHSFEGWLSHIPGLKILAPATIEDARGMLWPALMDPNPVILFEHAGLFNMRGKISEKFKTKVNIDKAKIRREGKSISLITYGGCLPKVLSAAEFLAKEGIEAEVLDLRTLRPLDVTAIIQTVQKTHRVVIVDEGTRSVGLSGEIVGLIVENAFYYLDAPPKRVCSEEVPIPYPRHLEEAALPQVEKIVKAVKEIFNVKI